jgi:molecular chaperone Hsp33
MEVKMSDYVARAYAREAGVRALACITSDLAREASRRHEMSTLGAAALAHGLTAAVLLGALLKVQQRVALKAEGDGPLGKIVVEADSYGRVRGYASVPDLPSPDEIGRDEVAVALGRRGLLTVVKDLGLRDLAQGTIPLETGELDKELTHYLERSEQIPSLVAIGVRMGQDGEIAVAGGLLIQPLPGQKASAWGQLVATAEALPALETLLADGHSPEEILAQVFGDIPYEVLEQRPLSFRCTCSRERSRQALKVLGPDEILGLLVEGEAVVDCHFCHERYVFDRDELAEILDELEEDALESMLDDVEGL